MTDRPILFSAPMVRALLEGRKTQTRRVIKGVPNWAEVVSRIFPLQGLWQWSEDEQSPLRPLRRWPEDHALNVRFAVGDRLWVRETCRAIERESGLDQFQYRATLDWEDDDAETVPNEPNAGGWGELSVYGRGVKGRKNFAERGDGLTFAGPWVPAIHAPRSTSRFTLTVTDVRVQRLQDISEEDAIAEGIEQKQCPELPGVTGWHVYADPSPIFVQRGDKAINIGGSKDTFVALDPRFSYQTLWESINGPGAWSANPWVVAVSFSVAQCNIDAEGRS